MEFITLFKDFGFPAIVVGVLLWILSTKLEHMALVIQQNHDLMIEIKGMILENREVSSGIKNKLERIEEKTTPRRGG